jgi:MFS family permease
MLASGRASVYGGKDYARNSKPAFDAFRGSMHSIDRPVVAAPPLDTRPWWRQPTTYQWFVLAVAAMGWLFDCMDQRIFIVSREPALTQLLGYERNQVGQLATYQGQTISDAERSENDARIKWYEGLATAIFMVGWATGGLIFGILGDRLGRARTMCVTILLYSAFTGLTALSTTWWDFTIYRFITGLGVGGEFAAGVALIAEYMPAAARPFALGLLQALSAIGNIAGSMLSWGISWRALFVVGIVPALLVVLIMYRLKEPEAWLKARASGGSEDNLGRMSDLFRERHWRRNTIIGVLLAVAGALGLWGVGFFTPELMKEMLRSQNVPSDTARHVVAVGMSLQDVGGAIGILFLTWMATRLGRRLAFGAGFAAALAGTIVVFGFMSTKGQVYWMLPLLGFCNLSVFGGYAIYFPELYPTRLRSTGTGFCYNAARYLGAVGPYVLGGLAVGFASLHLNMLGRLGGVNSPLRYAALSVALIYVLGLVTLPFAPETRGKPLPE